VAGSDPLERLLSAGALTGDEHAAVLDGVLRAADRRRRVRAGVAISVVGMLAAGVTLIAGGASLRDATPITSAIQAKGPSKARVVVELDCMPAGRRVCPVGSKLYLRFPGSPVSGFVAAYAQRANANEEPIVYFPGRDGRSPRVDAGSFQVVPAAVVIGREHRPGRYRVRVFLSRRQLSVDELLAGDGGEAVADAAIEVPPWP
jgi:hypothetical protein